MNQFCCDSHRMRLSARCTLGAILMGVSLVAHAVDIELLQPYEQVLKRAGRPTAEWSTALCPDRHIVLYSRPGAMLKLVFDERGRLHAVGFVALSQASAARWPKLGWPGLGYRLAEPYAYGSRHFSRPWFYNLSSKELSYFEFQRRPHSKSAEQLYLGSVTLSFDSDFASGRSFPYMEAELATKDEMRGQPVPVTPNFAQLRRWRSAMKPNAFVRVAPEPSRRNESCSGFFIGRVDQADMEKRSTPPPNGSALGVRLKKNPTEIYIAHP